MRRSGLSVVVSFLRPVCLAQVEQIAFTWALHILTTYEIAWRNVW